jgi:hypothetical protein
MPSQPLARRVGSRTANRNTDAAPGGPSGERGGASSPLLCSARCRFWPILLQKSGGSVRPNFPGPWECASKKRVGDHSIYCSLNERPPQPRHDSFEQPILIPLRFEAIFVTLRFSTFATESAHLGRQGRRRARPLLGMELPQRLCCSGAVRDPFRASTSSRPDVNLIRRGSIG